MHQPAKSATAKTPAMIDRLIPPPSSIRALRLTRIRVLSRESAGRRLSPDTLSITSSLGDVVSSLPCCAGVFPLIRGWRSEAPERGGELSVVESNERRPACAGVRAVVATAAREGLMREHEAGRPGTPGRWRAWIKRISDVATHVSAASLLASGMASSLAARKDKSHNDDRGGKDQTDRNRDGHGSERNREAKHADNPREDRRVQREHRDNLHRDGEGRHGHHSGKQEPQNDGSSDVHSAARQNNPTPTPTPTETPRGDGGGGGGDGGDGGGGSHRAGNAGSGLFDNPLATKARRRANDFDNAGQDDEHDGTFVDVHPEGDSVYETNSVAFTAGPDGLERPSGPAV